MVWIETGSADQIFAEYDAHIDAIRIGQPVDSAVGRSHLTQQRWNLFPRFPADLGVIDTAVAVIVVSDPLVQGM